MVKGGKGTKKTKGSKNDTDSDDDDANTANENSSSSKLQQQRNKVFSPKKQQQVDNIESETEIAVYDVVDMLNEKRPKQRQEGLELLVKSIRMGDQSVLQYQETLTTSLIRILRKPSSTKEVEYATILICLLSIIIEQDDEGEEFYNTFEVVLKKLVFSDQQEEIRVFALFALAFVCFLCSTETTIPTLLLCENIFCSNESSVYSDEYNEISTSTDVFEFNIDKSYSSLRVMAIQSWVILSSTSTDEIIFERSKDKIFESVSTLLSDSTLDIDIKIAAGEMLAYLWEVAEKNMPNSDAEDSGILLCENPIIVTQTLSALKYAARESSKKVSKRDRKEQHAAFRDIERWIFEGEMLDDSIRVQGCCIEVNNFYKIMLVNHMKIILGDGFHAAFKLFPILRDILEIESVTDAMDGDGDGSKIAKGSRKEKTRSSNKKLDRKYKEVLYENNDDSESWY